MDKNRLIRITEQDLHTIIIECTNRILNEQNCVETYYRGGDLRDNGFMWLTPQNYYAKEYAKEMVNPTIWEFKIDESKIKPISIFDIENIVGVGFDPYDPTEEEIQLVVNEGYNAYYLEYDSYNAEGLCLLSREPIISVRRLTEKEYNIIKGYRI